MSIEPIELWLETRALRRGLVYPIDPDTDPTALSVQDSGMVPVSTQIAIVNPETCQLCHVGEYGEIWVQSEGCAKSFYMSKQAFDAERFNGHIIGGDPNAQYVRTGDLGFLHNVTRPIGAGNQPVEMQILFVLGGIGETFDVNGLNHFPVDIENSVERCHRNISAGGSAVFQAGGLVVVLVEVFRKAYLASIVPVIVNAILNGHQVVVDIVAFVGHGDFPRSRLGEKQRGKILASWVTRKLRTIAQFAIRDPDGETSQITEVQEPRSREAASLVSKSNTPADMLRSSIVSDLTAHAAPASDASVIRDVADINPELQLSTPYQSPSDPPQTRAGPDESRYDKPTVALNDQPYHDLPAGISEMPTNTFDDHSDYGEDTHDDEKVYDPNADPFYPYGEDTPQAATSESDLSPLGGRQPRSIMNPDDYHQQPESTPNTPLTATASPSGSTPASAHPASAMLNINPEWKDDESPYSDAGNPFAKSIPASVPSFDFVNSPPTPRAPPPQIPLPNPPAASSVLARGRAGLPSQQARFSSYGTVTASQAPQLQERSALRHVVSPADIPHRGSDESTGNEEWSQEALLYNTAADKSKDRQLSIAPASDPKRQGDMASVAGSVRRRYDGSGYDEW